MNNNKISVALAAYNGEKYIAEQIKSILSQLDKDDEIIISDDSQSQNTNQFVRETFPNESRIKLIPGPGKGLIKNFENAISHCSGDYIFLSDQDDIWLENKVKACVSTLEAGNDFVLHNGLLTDKDLKSKNITCFDLYNPDATIRSNIIKNSFVGCCMAFKKASLLPLLPFPDGIPMHDWYLGLKLLKQKKNFALLKQPLIYWRRHGKNVTGGKTSLRQKIKWRINIIKEINNE